MPTPATDVVTSQRLQADRIGLHLDGGEDDDVLVGRPGR